MIQNLGMLWTLSYMFDHNNDDGSSGNDDVDDDGDDDDDWGDSGFCFRLIDHVKNFTTSLICRPLYDTVQDQTKFGLH